MINWFKTKILGKPQEQIAQVSSAPGIPTRKWVTNPSNGRVGIIDSYIAPGVAILHYVNAVGETVESVEINIGNVRVSYLEEIPENRRPDLQTGISLGYFPAPRS